MSIDLHLAVAPAPTVVDGVTGELLDSTADPDAGTALVPRVEPRLDARNPYWVYVRGLRREQSQRTMRGALDRVAHLIVGAPLPRKAVTGRPGVPDRPAVPATINGAVIPWEDMRYPHDAQLATLLAAQGWSPSYVNTHLIAVSRVMREAWLLGLMSAEDYQRAKAALTRDTGTREVAGRMLDRAEIAAHLDTATRPDPKTAKVTAKGIRDAALLAVAASTGARRGELIAATVRDWNPDTGLLLRGKGNNYRRVPLAPWVGPYLAAWLQVRGMAPGPLFTRCSRWGGLTLLPISGQTVADVLRDRAAQAGTAPASPHDYRRTFASVLLDDAQTDLVTVQHLMGHASPTTTSRYDRRGEKAGRAAIDRLPDPHDQETSR